MTVCSSSDQWGPNSIAAASGSLPLVATAMATWHFSSVVEATDVVIAIIAQADRLRS